MMSPSAVIPMNVPPRAAAASTTATALVSKRLAPIPRPSTRHARANAVQLPCRRSSQTQKATEGNAVIPTTSHTTGSRATTSGVVRTSWAMNVAVITYPNPKSP